MIKTNLPLCLSIITTTDPTARQLSLLLQATSRLAHQNEQRIEVIIVDDLKLWPSADASSLGEYQNLDLQIVWYPEQRGQLKALLTGMAVTESAHLLTIDPDMHACVPEIPAMLALMNQGHPVVHGVRHMRPDANWLRRFGSVTANAVVRTLAGIRVKDIGSPVMLLKREILQQHQGALKHGNPKLNLYRLLGDQIAHYPLTKSSSAGVPSQYSFTMLVKTFLMLFKDCLLLRLKVPSKPSIGPAFPSSEKRDKTKERKRKNP